MTYIGNGYEAIQENLWTRWCEARLRPAPVTFRRLTKRTEQKALRARTQIRVRARSNFIQQRFTRSFLSTGRTR